MSEAEKVFSTIYHDNIWGDGESVSGYGSSHQQTQFVKIELPYVLEELNVRTMLDLPCGDFNWMKDVDLTRLHYTGADIVPDLAKSNNASYANAQRTFTTLDLTSSPLPKVDLIFTRDCLVHLPNELVFAALRNICLSGSTYFMTTSFSWRFFNANNDIPMGHWRRINLEIAPFHLPPPMRFLVEGCSESEGQLGDKTLGIWPVSQIKRRLQDKFPELALPERANTFTGVWKMDPLIKNLAD